MLPCSVSEQSPAPEKMKMQLGTIQIIGTTELKRSPIHFCQILLKKQSGS
jgi:hypothetical protein